MKNNQSPNKYDNTESLLFQVRHSNFTTFDQMELFLQSAEVILQERVSQITSKIEQAQAQLQRTAGVYHLNQKKRENETEMLQLERKKVVASIEKHRQRLNIAIHPITLVLKEKHQQIDRLTQTKQVLLDFNHIMQGSQQDMNSTLLLDETHFPTSAFKIYIFKCVLDELKDPQYQRVQNFIRRRFVELKTKIISTFKEGFLKVDMAIIEHTLPYCEEYDLMDEIADYYTLQAFKETHKVAKVEEGSLDLEIKNFFFLIKRGFTFAFGKYLGGKQKNYYKVDRILGKYTDFISRRLISYVFQKVVKETVDSVLKNSPSNTAYLKCLQLFYSQCKTLLVQLQQLIEDDRLHHLLQTHIESILDIYLQNYLGKEIMTLERYYQDNIGLIVQQLKIIENRQEVEQKPTSKKFSFKKLMVDYKLQTKKVYSPDVAREKMQTLSGVFMDPALQRIFQVTKHALNRNSKVSKLNETDKNRNEILQVFLRELGQLIGIIIDYMKDTLPSYDDQAQPLQTQFFNVVPQINVLLQRMEYLYSDYKKQAKYELSESLRLQQKKQNLILNCEKRMNNIVADALACILSSEKAYIRQRKVYMKSQQEPISNKLYQLLQRYTKAINRINQTRFKTSLLKTMGLQFVDMLIGHFSGIAYSKEGLGGIFVDVSAFSKMIKLFNMPAIEGSFKAFKSLIDVYVLRNNDKELQQYLQSEREGVLKGQSAEVINAYLRNKKQMEKNAV